MRLQILVKTGLLKVRQLPLLPRLIYIASYSVAFAISLGINYIWCVLLSQIVRRDELILLWHEEMLPSLLTLSSEGPIQVNFKFLFLCHFRAWFILFLYTIFYDSKLHTGWVGFDDAAVAFWGHYSSQRGLRWFVVS